MLVKTYSAAVLGLDAETVTIEVNLAQGINFFIVGLPDSAIKESQQRIKAAFSNNNFRLPGKEITVNMAPADMRKEGSLFDLPIAMGILAASKQVDPTHFSTYMMVGELSLDGKLNPMKGALSIALNARKRGFKGVILPMQNAKEAAMVEGVSIHGAHHLTEVVGHFSGKKVLPETKSDADVLLDGLSNNQGIDFEDVKGQLFAKRAFEIAAAGGHNLILIGPPGSGKSMLAKRMPSILPPMSLEEALESTKIHSVVGKTSGERGLILQRPFRKPHHTISDVALVGGGGFPQPGEISLAHNGVLFLDELPEYKRTVLEVMRQPMEDRVVTISRAKFSVDYPARFMLVAAMNPCPCGYYSHPTRECTCGTHVVQRYLNRVSGPLMDRIDIHVEVAPVNYQELSDPKFQEPSAPIRERVLAARKVQQNRFKGTSIHANAEMSPKHLRTYCKLDPASADLLKRAMDKFSLSARAYDRILKVARTVADLNHSHEILGPHIGEAIRYRSLDRPIV